MADRSVKTELMRVGTPVRLVTLRKFLDALDDTHDETMVRHHAGSLIIEAPNDPLALDADGDA